MNKRAYKDTLIYKASKVTPLIFMGVISAVCSVFLFSTNPNYDRVVLGTLLAILAIAFTTISIYLKISWLKLESLYNSAEILHTDNFSLEPLPYVRRRLIHNFMANSRFCVKIEGKRYYSKHRFYHNEFEEEINSNKHLYFFLRGNTLYPLWFDFAEN